ncbi:MAG: type II toxin-antitoxin system VapC family toxin [Candidatus Omnitrophica bacterium]|nr:type II toxin-antitoxin system VapC family toxin [Candidatus Omnitrophota bacterium]
MKAFLDTSALIKKYVSETGSSQLETQLEEISEIIVAPIYWVELNSAIERRLTEQTLTRQQAIVIRREAGMDLNYFSKALWNDSLEEKAIEMIRKYPLKTLDGIQLAAGILARAEVFLTSDQDLYKAALKELKTNARLIGGTV